jgi:hypothetical protein
MTNIRPNISHKFYLAVAQVVVLFQHDAVSMTIPKRSTKVPKLADLGPPPTPLV